MPMSIKNPAMAYGQSEIGDQIMPIPRKIINAPRRSNVTFVPFECPSSPSWDFFTSGMNPVARNPSPSPTRDQDTRTHLVHKQSHTETNQDPRRDEKTVMPLVAIVISLILSCHRNRIALFPR
jgi:hypothetical protein